MVFAVSIGGLTQIVPLFFQDVTNKPVEGMKPYTALQLEGRDIYIREGCVGCHSQMIRPFRAETERYGHYSVAGESVWDHPFLWGSKRTGPDLARSARATPMTGTARTCTTRATWCRSRKCRPTRGW
jgi:cytochrome c oxidase cbb3-type subunit 2